MKRYVIISGFDTQDNNRGTSALSYGAICFCLEKGYLSPQQELLSLKPVLKFWNYKDYEEYYKIDETTIKHNVRHIFLLEKKLYDKYGILIPFTKLSKYIKRIAIVAAINGGDGFSDIYGGKTYMARFTDTFMAMKAGIPIIQLPQTMGPFKEKGNYQLAERILKYAQKVYVRDDKFIEELDSMNVKYEITKDLSAYMKPEPFNIQIEPYAVGINISGLAYSNKFQTLSGQFDQYPHLINLLIEAFQAQNTPVYLIPHTYNHSSPVLNNDDLQACKIAFEHLSNKKGVTLVDQDLISPQVKYVISRMSYFIGTRMHANFAAIYTNVPLYGLAYSYKFEGAFKANGVFDDNVSVINNITKEEAIQIVDKIVKKYKENHK